MSRCCWLYSAYILGILGIAYRQSSCLLVDSVLYLLGKAPNISLHSKKNREASTYFYAVLSKLAHCRSICMTQFNYSFVFYVIFLLHQYTVL
jgi:hypothetical protein